MSLQKIPPDNAYALGFTTDSSYASGFLVSLATALFFSNLKEFNLYVAHPLNDPIDAIWSRVEALCARFEFPFERCYRVPVDTSGFKDLHPLYNGSYFGFARYYLASIVEEPVLAYLDSDTLTTADLSKLVQELPQKYPLAAIEDRYIQTHDRDPYLLDNKKGTSNKPYFNSGVLLFNTQHCRHMGLIENFKALQPRLQNLRFSDQTPANILFQDKWFALSTSWNAQSTPNRPNELITKKGPEHIGIVHYITAKKPWISAQLNIPSILWYTINEKWQLSLLSHEVSDALQHLIEKHKALINKRARLESLYFRLRKQKDPLALEKQKALEFSRNLSKIDKWFKYSGLQGLPKRFALLCR